MEVISIYNGKGGTCKTSVALNLGWFLASLGRVVAVVDCDGQGNASSILPHPFREPTLRHVITQNVPLHQAMYMARTNFYVVPADPHLAEAVRSISASKDWFVMANRIDELRQHVDCTPRPSPLLDTPTIRLRDLPTLAKPSVAAFHTPPAHLDYLIFDHVPNPDDLTDAALYASDGILIPCELEKFAMDGIPRTLLGLNELFARWRRNLHIHGIIPVNVDHRRTITAPFLTNLLTSCGPLMMREIHTDASVPNAQAFGETVLEYQRSQRQRPSWATREFFQIALQLIGFKGSSPDVLACEKCEALHQQVQLTAPAE